MKAFGKGNEKINSDDIAAAVKTAQEKAKAEVEEKNAVFLKLTQALDQAVKGMQIMQVNVGKSGAVTDLALYHAFDKKAGILLLGEPWIGQDLERKRSKKTHRLSSLRPWKRSGLKSLEC